jgi:hypothetical protein
MSTPLDYAEFYFDHVDKGESMKAPDEGVAAPLEPTRLEQIEPSTHSVASGYLHCLDLIGKGTHTVEGVAARCTRNPNTCNVGFCDWPKCGTTGA